MTFKLSGHHIHVDWTTFSSVHHWMDKSICRNHLIPSQIWTSNPGMAPYSRRSAVSFGYVLTHEYCCKIASSRVDKQLLTTLLTTVWLDGDRYSRCLCMVVCIASGSLVRLVFSTCSHWWVDETLFGIGEVLYCDVPLPTPVMHAISKLTSCCYLNSIHFWSSPHSSVEQSLELSDVV